MEDSSSISTTTTSSSRGTDGRVSSLGCASAVNLSHLFIEPRPNEVAVSKLLFRPILRKLPAFEAPLASLVVAAGAEVFLATSVTVTTEDEDEASGVDDSPFLHLAGLPVRLPVILLRRLSCSEELFFRRFLKSILISALVGARRVTVLISRGRGRREEKV